MTSTTARAAPPPEEGPGRPADAGPGLAPGPGTQPAARHGNWHATVALLCGMLGGALVTIAAGLVFGILGLRRAQHGAGGALRCWLGIGFALAWAGVAGYLTPHLIRAVDPGCVVYKGSALTAYDRVADDVGTGVSRGVLSRDLTTAISQFNQAARATRNPAAARSLTALSRQMRIVVSDLRAGVVVPRQVMLAANQDAAFTDRACGTVHL